MTSELQHAYYEQRRFCHKLVEDQTLLRVIELRLGVVVFSSTLLLVYTYLRRKPQLSRRLYR